VTSMLQSPKFDQEKNPERMLPQTEAKEKGLPAKEKAIVGAKTPTTHCRRKKLRRYPKRRDRPKRGSSRVLKAVQEEGPPKRDKTLAWGRRDLGAVGTVTPIRSRKGGGFTEGSLGRKKEGGRGCPITKIGDEAIEKSPAWGKTQEGENRRGRSKPWKNFNF